MYCVTERTSGRFVALKLYELQTSEGRRLLGALHCPLAAACCMVCDWDVPVWSVNRVVGWWGEAFGSSAEVMTV